MIRRSQPRSADPPTEQRPPPAAPRARRRSHAPALTRACAQAGRKVAFVAPAHALGSDIKGLAFASPAGDVGESTGKDKSKDASKARAGEAEAAGEAQPRQDPKAMEMDGAEAETRSFP
jgi:hypothetical protein